MGATVLKTGPTVVKECPICGKRFIPTVEWVYRLGSKFYCRYTCYNKAGGDKHKKYRTNGKGWI